MSNLNRFTGTGNLTRDPETQHSNSGIAITKFTIACGRPTKNEQGEYECDFINIVCFRQQAEYAQNYLRKGDPVYVDGRLQIRNYTGQDGVKRQWTEIRADNIGPTFGRRERKDVPSEPGENEPDPFAGDAAAQALAGGGADE